MDWTPESLRAFEEDIAQEFNAGKIRAPIHLESGNESQLLEIFRDVGPNDWVLCSWRSHLKCLLRGVPPGELKAAIMRGRSITLCFPSHRILSSAIVGGILPIAVGLGMGIKRRGGSEKVWAFVGDMTALTGLAGECMMYSHNFDLPVEWVIEGNGKSVCTPTADAWNYNIPDRRPRIRKYTYNLPYPHSGAGVRVNF